MIEFAAETHSGLKRSHNEDCYEAAPALGLWLVADGVGGHSCGEVASDIVRTTIKDSIAAGETLLSSIEKSHQAVLAAIRQRQAAQGMGSTVIALLLDGNNYEISWVGDSRAYLWHNGLRQLSHDHNRVSELLANKMITPQQAISHRERHVLTQSLGVSEKMALEPGQITGTLDAGQQILLCSDGLTDELPDKLIARLMARHHTPQAQVDALIKAALDAGGNDNITAVVIGDCADSVANDETDLETTRDISRAVENGKSRPGSFPLKTCFFICTLAFLALWLLL